MRLTYFPRNIELQLMLRELPPATVDTQRSVINRLDIAVRYFEILENYMTRNPKSVLEIGSGQGSWIDTTRTRYSIKSEKTIAIDGLGQYMLHQTKYHFVPVDINDNLNT